MAVGTFTLYDNGLLKLLDGTIDFDADTIVAILLADAYTPSAAHDTYSDVSANVIADGDYAPQVVGSPTVTVGSSIVKFDSAIISFGSSVTIEAEWLALVQRAGGALAGTDLLIGYIQLDDTTPPSSTNGTFSFDPNAANGYFGVTAA